MRTLSFSALAAALTVLPMAATTNVANAQQPQAMQPPPQITVTARGEVQVTPDRARVQLGVETQARTAAAAATENNRKQAAVLAAVRGLGIAAKDISTMGYNVYPVTRYDEKERRTIVDGYRVSNIVQVEVEKIDQAGPVIDAALGAGANRVAGLDFYVKDASKAREEALTKAVTQARQQALIAATAAGGQIAEMLEINVNDFEQPMPRQMAVMRAAPAEAAMNPAPISEGTTTVAVVVMTRWRFERR